MAEVEEVLNRLKSMEGIEGVIIANSQGIPIRSTLDNTSTVEYVGLVHELVIKTRMVVKEMDPQDDITVLRVRSKKNEILITPNEDYFMVVIQNPSP